MRNPAQKYDSLDEASHKKMCCWEMALERKPGIELAKILLLLASAHL